MMRPFIYLLLSAMVFTACFTAKKSTADAYTITTDKGTKILSGKLSRSLIENDTAFKWFKENIQFGEADESAVRAIQKNAGKFSLVIVAGTWCHDSQNLLPKFFRLIEKAGYPENKVLFIGVDRNKIALNNLQLPYHITRTPTFIVLQNGKEVGRVIEYGKTGYMEKELGEIIAGL